MQIAMTIGTKQKARGSLTCDFHVPNWKGELVTCGKSKAAHKDNRLEHSFGGPLGTHTILRLPVCGGICKRQIQKGEEYRKWTVNFGPTFIRCMTCPAPSRSSMTSSEILAQAWEVADQDIDAFDTAEDFDDIKWAIAEQIQEVVDMIQEKQDNIESGFGHTSVPVWEELDERRSGYEDWQNEVDSLDSSNYEDWEVCKVCGLSNSDCGASGEDHNFEASFDVEAARSALEEAVSNAPE